MRFQIDGFTSVVSDAEGNVHVTRPGMTGKVQTHNVGNKYHPLAVALWLKLRLECKPNSLVQNEFPNMSADDREFLMTGITPAEWKEIFSREDDECESTETTR